MASTAAATTPAAGRASSWVRAAAAPALLLLIIAGFFWRITLTYEFDWMWEPDLALQVLPWLEEEARQVQRAEFPLWDPMTWAGQPMLGQGQPGAAYPLNWLLFLIPRHAGHINSEALQWYFVIIHYMAALFCYLLCRDLGLSRAASMAGGLVFALGGYIGTTRWPQMLNGAVWAPLVFLFLLRAVRGYRPLASSALAGLCLGMSWLSGHHQAPIYITLSAGFAWIYYALRRRSVKLAMLGALSVVLMFLTAALQILPMIEYGRLAKRWINAPEPVTWNQPVPYIVHRDFSSPILSAFGILIPGEHGYTDPFLGVVAVSLVAIAVVTAWKREWVKFFAAVAAGGFLYSLGSNNIFQGFLYSVVPFLDKARTPAAAICIFSAAAAVLAAFGFDQLPALSHTQAGTRAAGTVVSFGLLLWLAILFSLVAGTTASNFIELYSSTGFFALIAGAVLFGWRNGALGSRTVTALLLGCMLMEFGKVSGSEFGDRNDYAQMAILRKIYDDQDIADFLDRQHRPFRIELETDDLAENWPEYHHFEGLKSALASLTLNATDMEVHIPAYRSLWNAGFTIGRETAMPDAQVVFEGKSGRKVFRNPQVFPRAWAVHRIATVPSVADGQALVRDHLEDLHSEAFVEGAVPPDWKPAPCGGDTVSVTRYEAERVRLRAAMACDGVVVLSDMYYPGWQALIDGKPAAIHQVNLAMRGVAVPAGDHEIQYVFRPASAYLGAILTAVGILAVGLIVFRKSPASARRALSDHAQQTS
ncbi:MAG TPA: YfhO family protein [Bryobacteraceae bacterium]|nr:YfhO family protein [Bryobacteraceae bacterium]